VEALTGAHFTKFRNEVLPAFVKAGEQAAGGGSNPWPNSMRVKKVEGAEGIWEMTWSWKDPDGRATWEWITLERERAIRWRRVGALDVFKSP